MINERILSLYDDFVATQPGGVKVADAKDGIRQAVRDLVAAQARDLDAETEIAMTQVIGTERDKRSRNLRRDFEYLLDGLTEDGAYLDPILDRAYRLGNAAGTDKLLRFWTTEDIRDAVVGRYRSGSDAMAAAAEFDAWASRVLSQIRARGSASIGDAWRAA